MNSSSHDSAIGAFIGLNGQNGFIQARIATGVSFNGVEEHAVKLSGSESTKKVFLKKCR
jgi:hypothetical protein